MTFNERRCEMGVPLFNFEEKQKMRQLLSIDTNPKTIKARPHVGN